jgi:hypothetical protein
MDSNKQKRRGKKATKVGGGLYGAIRPSDGVSRGGRWGVGHILDCSFCIHISSLSGYLSFTVRKLSIVWLSGEPIHFHLILSIGIADNFCKTDRFNLNSRLEVIR